LLHTSAWCILQRPPSAAALAACPPVCHRTLQASSCCACCKHRPPSASSASLLLLLSARVAPEHSLTTHSPPTSHLPPLTHSPTHPRPSIIPPTRPRASPRPLARSFGPASRQKRYVHANVVSLFPTHPRLPVRFAPSAIRDVDIARPPTGCSRQPLARQPPTSSASTLSFAAVPHSKRPGVPFVLHPI
jgi:hypothetical protein